MFKSTESIMRAAEVLEKVAAVFEQEEIQETEKKAEEVKKNFIDPISDSVTDLPKSVAEKLAHADPEILNFVKSLAGQKKEAAAEDISLGGGSEKLASDEVDDALLAFMLDPA